MYDLADPRYEAPSSVSWFRLDVPSEEKIADFECRSASATGDQLLREVGSRALLRLFDEREEQAFWLTVQPNRYPYSYRLDDAFGVRMVLRGFPACEVRWSN